MEMIRFVLGSLFILCGLVIFIIEIFGNFRFGYVLNRMQAAAIGDSFGIVLCLVGTMFYFGWSLACLKLLFVEIFLWLSSPVSSHLVAKLEAETNEDLGKEVKIREIK
ncbi:MAG: monovalent cation/H(+) antiporter subunit G, partial [Firmicutes bacterium]|nr:monovalent cation/H(+) antiporter subunit G [Bacillota bacterium]